MCNNAIFNYKYITQFLPATFALAMLLYVLFAPYIAYKKIAGSRSWSEIATMLPRLESWFYTSGSFFNIFNTIGRGLPMQHEHVMFLGLTPYILFFTTILIYFNKYDSAFLAKHKNAVFTSIALISMVFIFTLFVGGETFYHFTFYKIPGFDSIRAVTRIILFLAFPFSILVSFTIDIISNSTFNILKKIVLLTTIILYGAFEQCRSIVGTYSKAQAQERYFSIYEKVKNISDYDLVYLKREKPKSSFYIDELDAMYLALILNKNTINGYSGNNPLNYNLHYSNNQYVWVMNNKNYFLNKKLLVIENEIGHIFALDDSFLLNLASNLTSQKQPLKSFSNKLELVSFAFINSNTAKAQIKVTNTTNEKWGSAYSGKYGLALSYTFDSENKYNERFFLPHDLHSNESVEVPINFSNLKQGKNILKVSMVQEGVTWFHNNDGKELIFEIYNKGN